MNALMGKERKPTYFWIGIFLLGVISFVFVGEVRLILLKREPSFGWQTITGLLLLIALSYQWILAIVRILKLSEASRTQYYIHRWMGIAATVLFLVHALRFGYAWTSALSIVFILTALTGLLNKEVVRYKQRWMYQLWLGTHLVLSAIMAPLIIVHIWIALAYQGGI